jgi:hypothetical protein
MRRWTSGGMPTPVSETVMTAYSPSIAPGNRARSLAPSVALPVAIVSVPPSGIASLAFTTRFINTCSSCVLSASTTCVWRSRLVRIDTLAEMRRRSIGSSVSTTGVERERYRLDRLLAAEGQ